MKKFLLLAPLAVVIACAIFLAGPGVPPAALVANASVGPGSTPAAGSQSPALPSALPRVVSIWGGARSAIVLKSDGSVWDWGMNWHGKLGDNTTIDRNVPVRVIFLDNQLFAPLVSR